MKLASRSFVLSPFFCYTPPVGRRHTTDPGGDLWICIAATPHFHMMPSIRSFDMTPFVGRRCQELFSAVPELFRTISGLDADPMTAIAILSEIDPEEVIQ